LVGSDDLPVESLRIGATLLTTEEIIDEDTTLSNWSQGFIGGLVGDNYVTSDV